MNKLGRADQLASARGRDNGRVRLIFRQQRSINCEPGKKEQKLCKLDRSQWMRLIVMARLVSVRQQRQSHLFPNQLSVCLMLHRSRSNESHCSSFIEAQKKTHQGPHLVKFSDRVIEISSSANESKKSIKS